MKNHLTSLVFLLLFVLQNTAQELHVSNLVPTADGEITFIAHDTASDVSYIGGVFAHVSNRRNFTYSTSVNDPLVSHLFPQTNNTVLSIIQDDAGGWYIAGDFTSVGDSVRNRLAHIDHFGNVTSWNPNANQAVVKLKKQGNKIFACGNFTEVNGQQQNYVCQLNAVTGELITWNPNPDNTVHDLAVYQNQVYLAGLFSTINGTTRNKLALVDTLNANVYAWNPMDTSTTHMITAVYEDGTDLYLGGTFDSFDGQVIEDLVKVDMLTNNSSSLDFTSDGQVFSIQKDNNYLYVGGSFTTAKDSLRNGICKLDLLTNNITLFNPDIAQYSFPYNPTISIIKKSNSSIFVSGIFDRIDGVPQKYYAKFDATSGISIPWDLKANGSAAEIKILNDTIILVGGFWSVNLENRKGLAAFNRSTGRLTSWNPNQNSNAFNGIYISDIKIIDTMIYIAGNFNQIGGLPRKGFAAISNTGILSNWTPIHNGTFNQVLYHIEIYNNKAFISGDFTEVNGEPRSYLAQFDLATESLTLWNPILDLPPNSIKVIDTNLYVAGNFSTINSQTRNRLASFNLNSSTLTNWSPILSISHINCIAGTNKFVIVGGQGAEVFDNTTGAQYPTLFYQSGLVQSIVSNEKNTYLCGGIYPFSSTSGSNFIRLNNYFLEFHNWENELTGDLYHISLFENDVYLGGENLLNATSGNTNMEIARVKINEDLTSNLFVLPASEIDSCNGKLNLDIYGTPYFRLKIDNGFTSNLTSNSNLLEDQCSGLHEIAFLDSKGLSQVTNFFIPLESNVLDITPFITLTPLDSLSQLQIDCNINYNLVDTAFIDSIYLAGDTLFVNWGVLINGINQTYIVTYELNNGNGAYTLQLGLYCPAKTLANHFFVNQTIYYDNGIVSLLDIKEHTNNFLNAFPNPTDNFVNLHFNTSEAELTVFNSMGNIVRSKHKIENNCIVDLSSLESGMYILQICTEASIISKRVFKK